MKQLLFIHWWSCFFDNDTFCKALEIREYDPFEDKKKRKDWLKETLQWEYQIIKPDMPNKDMATYKAWKIRFEKIFPYFNDEELIVVWNSLGGMFLIKYLWENDFPKKIKQLHLVASVFDESGMPDQEKYLGDFLYDTKVISNLESKAEKIFIYHSTDDTIVPYSHAEKILSYLPSAQLITFTDRGHFSIPEFPELLENIINQ